MAGCDQDGGAVGEVRLASWDEIDLAGRAWTMLARRVKAKRGAGSRAAAGRSEVLDTAHTLGDSNRSVFPMRSGEPIATSTPPKMLQHHEVAAVAYGLSLRRSIAMAHSSTVRPCPSRPTMPTNLAPFIPTSREAVAAFGFEIGARAAEDELRSTGPAA